MAFGRWTLVHIGLNMVGFSATTFSDNWVQTGFNAFAENLPLNYAL